MMHQTLKFIMVILLMMVVINCKKKTRDPDRIPELEKKWFWLDTGSYFIYSDSIGFVDSIYVTNIEHFLTKVSKYAKSETYLCTLSNGFIFELEAMVNVILLKKTNLSDYVPNIIYDISYPSRKNNSANGFLVTNYRDTILPTYNTNANKFDSTMVWNIYPDYIMQSKNSSYYFSKGVGFSRLIDNQRNIDRRLIRYKINRFIGKPIEQLEVRD